MQSQETTSETSERIINSNAVNASESNDEIPKLPLKWYTLQTHTNRENAAKKALEQQIEMANMHSSFGDILMPMETVFEVKAGVQKVTKRKIYSGYLFVQMNISDESWQLVKGTPMIFGFVGGKIPAEVSTAEMNRIFKQMQAGEVKPQPKITFAVGSTVRVVDGPFINFTGTVEEAKADKGKVKVAVSIFGRITSVELDFKQVENVSE